MLVLAWRCGFVSGAVVRVPAEVITPCSGVRCVTVGARTHIEYLAHVESWLQYCALHTRLLVFAVGEGDGPAKQGFEGGSGWCG